MTVKNDLSLYDKADWWNEKDELHLLSKMNPGRFEFFERFIPNLSELKVLDVGCGGGFTCEHMAKKGATVVGVDLSESSLKQAKAHAKASHLEIRYEKASALELPFEDGSFDAITCVDVLEHIENWPKALQEFNRVLKPGGHLLFDTINRNPISSFVLVFIMEKVLGMIARGTHDPAMFIKPSEMKQALESSGFSNLKMAGLGLLWSVFKRDFFAFTGGPLWLMYIGCVRKIQ